tara:strand:+ start:2209 stop:3402 length:1194 start_codon:yes stop_codon:yes gene_type:complete
MVSDSKDINPRTIRAHNIAANAITTAKVGKKIIHTEAADPTTAADAGTGYEVGSIWNNTSSGEVFICTDSSEEGSVWRGQEGENVNHSPAWQGLTYAYEMGGSYPGPTVSTDAISRYPLSAPYPQSDVGEQAQAGFSSGNYVGPGNVGFQAGAYTPGSAYIGEVVSFPTAAASGVTTSNQGELNQGGWAYGSNGWSPTHGYTFGGQEAPGGKLDTITDFTFASFASSDTTAEMADGRDFTASHDDATHSYQSGGWNPGTSNNIDRYQKGTSTNSTDTGELVQSRYGVHGNSDVDGGYGYANGGGGPPPLNEVDVIQRFPFASSTPSADIGEMATTGAYGSMRGASSMTHGHSSSRIGSPGPGTVRTRFPFASSSAGADIGEVANEANANDDVGMICV